MSKKHALITGSAGLIGSQAVEFFIEKGFKIVGIDNDMRAYFFGQEAPALKKTKPAWKRPLEINIYI